MLPFLICGAHNMVLAHIRESTNLEGHVRVRKSGENCNLQHQLVQIFLLSFHCYLQFLGGLPLRQVCQFATGLIQSALEQDNREKISMAPPPGWGWHAHSLFQSIGLMHCIQVFVVLLGCCILALSWWMGVDSMYLYQTSKGWTSGSEYVILPCFFLCFWQMLVWGSIV